GTASGTGAHDHGNLRDALSAHVGLVEEDASEVFAVGEYLILAWQVGAPRIDQINTRKTVLLGNGLRAQVFFYRQRVIGAAFDCRVVCDNHAVGTDCAADAGNHTSGGYLFAIDIVSSQLCDPQKRRARVEQRINTLAG